MFVDVDFNRLCDKIKKKFIFALGRIKLNNIEIDKKLCNVFMEIGDGLDSV